MLTIVHVVPHVFYYVLLVILFLLFCCTSCYVLRVVSIYICSIYYCALLCDIVCYVLCVFRYCWILVLVVLYCLPLIIIEYWLLVIITYCRANSSKAQCLPALCTLWNPKSMHGEVAPSFNDNVSNKSRGGAKVCKT